jgi:hypothetical protein
MLHISPVSLVWADPYIHGQSGKKYSVCRQPTLARIVPECDFGTVHHDPEFNSAQNTPETVPFLWQSVALFNR